MTRPPRARIRQSFERAATTYDRAAGLQRIVCHHLASLLPTDLGVRRLLDAGCGTGYAQALLQQRFPNAVPLALDLAEGMLRQVATPCLRLAGDVEHLPLASASIDLYWSSLTVQWCDLALALGEARRVLRPGGHLAVATLGSDTFHELRSVYSAIDGYRHTLHFLAPSEISAATHAAGLRQPVIARRREVMFYPDFHSLLRAVKDVGANQVGAGQRTGLAGRHAFRLAEAAYEQLRQADGLPLSYDVITLSART